MKFLANTFLTFMLTSCANIVAPTGGDKDILPPKLLNISVIEKLNENDSKIIKFEFNEYIQLNEWEEYFYISPPIKNQVEKKIKGQTLIITIKEMLKKNTTYYLGLNSCVKDNNEGNVLDSLSYIFSTNDSFDTLTLSGILKDAYNLNPLKNCWVMLYEEDVNDSIIFKEAPNYISKTNKNGAFHFPNIKDNNYKIASVSDFDFIYNKEEKIAFIKNPINAKTDSFISLYAFDPIIKIDSTITSSSKLTSNSADSSVVDSIIKKDPFNTGKLKIISDQNSACILQLLQNQKIITEVYFNNSPYLIEGIIPGKYQLKYIEDNNQDSLWNTGNWERKIQPEKVINYPSEITIRSNWDLELEWIIEE